MIELNRFGLQYLQDWFQQADRKPLIIRGARQVGKSTLVKLFAEQNKLTLLTLDFEQAPEHADFFASKIPSTIVNLLSTKLSMPMDPKNTILFLDEIQKTPEVIASLRYFYEQMPELGIICAGSLLDLALEQINFSMPVGRVSYMFMGPMTFQEFLLALGHKQLVRFLNTYALGDPIPGGIHKTLLKLLKDYCFIGGLPEAVRSYVKREEIFGVDQIKHALINSYQEDFAKYATPTQQQRMRNIFNIVPQILGEKFKYSNISKDEKSTVTRGALDKLVLAKIITKVCNTAANGLPLGAEANVDFYKTFFLDVGLVCTALDLNYANFSTSLDITLVNSGKIAEQFIAQHLLYSRSYYETPALYYWAREKKSASAKIDFLIANNGKIIPIEVKAGASGTLKSLHYFLQEKRLNLGVKFSSQMPSKTIERVKSSPGEELEYQLLSLPLYMVEELSRLLS